jgi:hypothetical protein
MATPYHLAYAAAALLAPRRLLEVAKRRIIVRYGWREPEELIGTSESTAR